MCDKKLNKGSEDWIKPSFDTPLIRTTNIKNSKQLVKQKSRKRQMNDSLAENESKSRDCLKSTSICLLDSMVANNSEELALSRIKCKQLMDWFRKQFVDTDVNESKFLLLNGPTGTGKTTSLRVLAKEFKVEVIQYNTYWQNFESVLDYNLNERQENHSIRMNQIENFRQFIADSVRYKTRLDFESSDGGIGCSDASTLNRSPNRLVLIEEFPNIFYMTSEALDRELRLLDKRFGKRLVPIVFIISETINGHSEEYKLLPKSLQMDLRFQTIKFKPITDTSLQKVIQRLSADQLSQNEIKGLIAGTDGDIRSAINNLQLVYMHSIDDKNCDKSVKKFKKTKQIDSKCDFVFRDPSLTITHAIGKVLYAKRLNPEDQSLSTGERRPDSYQLPEHLAVNERYRLSDSPESISDKMVASSDVFNAWLHQNYVDFCDSLECAQNCMDWLCESDALFSGQHHFANQSLFESYQSCLAISGLMFNLSTINSQSIVSKESSNGIELIAKSNRKFKAFEKPKTFVVNRLAESLKRQISQSLTQKSVFSSVDSLVIDLMPFVSQMPKHLRSTDSHFQQILNKVVSYGPNNEQELCYALSHSSLGNTFDETLNDIKFQTNPKSHKSEENVIQINDISDNEDEYQIENIESDLGSDFDDN